MVIFFVIFEKRKINIRRTIACYTRAYNKQVTQNVCMHYKKKWNKFFNLQKKELKQLTDFDSSASIALVLWWYFSCSNYYLILCSMIFKREHSKARAPRLHYLLFVLVMLWSCDHYGLYISVSDRVSDIKTTLKVILQKHRYVCSNTSVWYYVTVLFVRGILWTKKQNIYKTYDETTLCPYIVSEL